MVVTIYDAFDSILKSMLPADCKVFRLSIPMQMINSLTRETAKLCVWMLTGDQIRVNTSGATPVHEVTIDVSVFGTLEDASDMANTLLAGFIGKGIEADGWHFELRQKMPGKQDLWEPQIQDKRVWLQLTGIVIEPAVTGTAG